MKTNQFITCQSLPVEIVFHPSWWNKHAGIVFDEDFFYHPLKRVESERLMEQTLYERFGQYGLGKDHDKTLPQIGAVHQAAGYLLSEMLGCEIRYIENAAPQVVPAHREDLILDPQAAFDSPAFHRLEKLLDQLQTRYGYLIGDINWSGVLNLAMDLRGEEVLTDMFLQPEELKIYFRKLATVIERFFCYIQQRTGSNSISVNRNVQNIQPSVYLHSECSHTMISAEQYEEFLWPIDKEWSLKHRAFGIHYCGPDAHRHVAQMAMLPHLDFLDAGWGSDIACLRQHLPNTFINVRLDPVSINTISCDALADHIRRLVGESANPYLTGVCCINMDDQTEDDKIRTIFETVEELRTAASSRVTPTMDATDHIVEIIEHSGIRATANRILIYRAIIDRTDTFSMNDLEESLETLDKSTIFRTLTLFAEHHLIHSMEDGSGQIKYCKCSHPGTCEEDEEHCHFYCVECKKSYCLPQNLVQSVNLPKGFEMTGINYVIKGVCASCAQKRR